MESSDIFVITPAGICDASLAIGACRAGARGILDIEYIIDLTSVKEALVRLERFTSNAYGVKISADISPHILDLIINASPQLAWVVIGGGDHPNLKKIVQRLRGRKLFFEAVCFDEVLIGEKLAMDGLILKGNEAQGRVGQESAFIFLQRWNEHAKASAAHLPVWVQGGIGVHTTAACLAASVTGVVLDSQLLLAREHRLSAEARETLLAFDGSETICLGEGLGEIYRINNRLPFAPLDTLLQEEARVLSSNLSAFDKKIAWKEAVHNFVLNHSAQGPVLLGQDVSIAKGLAQRYDTVGGIIDALVQQTSHVQNIVSQQNILSENSSFAKAHKIRFPIVQGPMTRVSDTAEFANAVSQAGGLPILALALQRGTETKQLLKQTQELLKDSSWGVGILGFLPPEIRQEQLDAIDAIRPPFALIAGGRPDQAKELEQKGIATFLHVPSPGLLKRFLQAGCRRFVFEGRECGGHVGPRSSFVLWESMIEVILEYIGSSGRGDDLHVLFAGGVHHALSGAMVSSLASSLAAARVHVGVLIGTAYLFTEEAVTTGAIVSRFQKEALECKETVLLQTGPGHAIRCVKTPYCNFFDNEKSRLQSEGQSQEEITKALEWMNIGRLRIASKGLDRVSNGSDSSQFAALSDEQQYTRGMYMIGQVASLRKTIITMKELHEDVCAKSHSILENKTPTSQVIKAEERPCDIAVIGMSCFYPGASDVKKYWNNILNRVNSVTEIPASHWDFNIYYDPNPKTPDKIISKWGGFLADIHFDPLTYGITPKSLYSIEPLQLFLLEAVRHALNDAGYEKRPFNRERTAAILGVGGAGSPTAVSYGLRTLLPLLDTVPDMPVLAEELLKKARPLLPEWTEDSFPGILLNVAVGRVANRFNFGGANYAIDAACGSSLAALYTCMRELETKTCDVAVAMGADTVQTPYSYMAFSKTHALSPRGKCTPFDAAADGIVLSEGISAVILKRLDDAVRDGDRIYAVIKGIGTSSDGKEKGLTAPNTTGQLRALNRAYSKANITPAQVGLIEAHGTGTVVGDQTEVNSLIQVFEKANAGIQSCALGSVKSMIGHSKCAAGLAGLIKVALSLHNKVLPPTIVDRPNPKAHFEKSPLFLNTEPRPWICKEGVSRCAGVSAFGFGGTNFHAVLEEYRGDYLNENKSAMDEFPAELLVFRGERKNIIEAIVQCQSACALDVQINLSELAAAFYKELPGDILLPTLAIVATSMSDLKEKLTLALTALNSSQEEYSDPRGIYFSNAPKPNKIAFLFPGQGSQYPNMLAQVAMAFPEIRKSFDLAEALLDGQFSRPLGKCIFPPSHFTKEEEREQNQLLSRTDIAQPSIGAASIGMYHLLRRFGITPDFLAGHSYGEYVALAAAGALSEKDLILLSHRRGKVILEATEDCPGAMVAVEAPTETVNTLLQGIDGVTIANDNSPTQTVLSGTEDSLKAAIELLKEKKIHYHRLPVNCGFHSPLVAPAVKSLKKVLKSFEFSDASLPVYSNTTASLYPKDTRSFAELLAKHMASPVRFREEINALYNAGAKIFIEVGPQGVLTGLVHSILHDHPHVAVASDLKSRPGLVQLQHLLAQLFVSGVTVQLRPLYEGRNLRTLTSHELLQPAKVKLSDSLWVVNSTRNRPIHAPEPHIIGQTKYKNTYTKKVSDDADEMMLRFQDLMANFLEMQKSVMENYLQGGSSSTAPKALTSLVSAKGEPLEAILDKAFQDEPSPKQAPANTAQDVFDEATLKAKLLELVSNRTGYPKDMIGLDLNLEADLGVDSIKRIEILGDLADMLGGLNESDDNSTIEMEKLTSIMTIRGIIDYLMAQDKLQNHPKEQFEQTVSDKSSLEIERALVTLVEAQAPLKTHLLQLSGCLLFTDDGRGIATELMGLLAEFGQKSTLIRMSSRGSDLGAGFSADLADPTEVENLLKKIKKEVGPVSGLIHLLPLALPPNGESSKERIEREVKSLYLLARGLEEDIRQSADTGGGVLLAATGMGGKLGYGHDPLPENFFSGHGGIAGFVKSLGAEWPKALVRVVDFDSGISSRDLASRILAEMSIQESPLEIGYVGSKRFTWEPFKAKLTKTATDVPLLAPDSTVLITGGARGITAAVTKALGEHFKPNLILVGRSPLPEDVEDKETLDLIKPADIKAAIIAKMKREGKQVVHSQVESAYQRLILEREIRTNLADIKKTGAKVYYYQVDVRDAQAFNALIDTVEQRFGKIDGVIHGAGIVEDKLLRDKTPESFTRVFDTKVESALILSQRLAPEHLKFLIFFASIVSRYGNKGQTDYAAANEVLSKLAISLDKKWPARVFSVAWGPWSDIGMGKELGKHLKNRGLKLISPDEGAALLLDELFYGKKGESEVMIAGGAEHMAIPVQSQLNAQAKLSVQEQPVLSF
jgi:acyl transferase domain-containing protein/NAD(P)H-dependent flavin oxidoreductase YrpB (nitropropane dioxygenase family)/NAD(P)-dependent dehydrogenase (short-subunit alcohol dehydrogenase family)/acyl carrier protein